MSFSRLKYVLFLLESATGIGISEDAQRNLFNPFSQADSSISRRFGGTGLGLAICKRLVSAMKGEIKINSTIGEGSTFHFTIPMEAGQSKDISTKNTDATDIPPMNILVADDNPINQKVLVGILSKDKHKVVAVDNGQQALDAIKAEQFNVVLMDMEMPIMNGIEATSLIRSMDDKQKSRIPIIAMTANVMKEDIERCRQAGMNEYVSKPIDPDSLRSLIGRVAVKDGAFQPSRRETDPLRTSIDPDTQAKEPSVKTDDTIVAPAAPEQPKPTAPNVQVVTAPQQDSSPPPSTQSTDTPVTPGDISSDQTSNTDPQTDPQNELLFNEAVLGDLKTSLGNESLNEMMQDLYEKSEELITAMERALSEEDYEALRGRAHDIKGMTSNFGLTGISDVADPIESGARAQRPFETLAPHVRKLRSNYTALRTQLDNWMKQ